MMIKTVFKAVILACFLLFIFYHDLVVNKVLSINPSYGIRGSVDELNARSKNIDGIKVTVSGVLSYSLLEGDENKYALFSNSEASNFKDHAYSLILFNLPDFCFENLKKVDSGYRAIVHGEFRKYRNGEINIDKIKKISSVVFLKPGQLNPYADSEVCSIEFGEFPSIEFDN